MRKFISKGRSGLAALLGAALLTVPLVSSATAEISQVRIVQQFGLAYLPLIVARNQHLIEKRAAAAGLPDLTVDWVRLGGGAAANDALLSGSVEFVTTGLGPFLTIWDKTRGRGDVRGVIALDASAVALTVNRADIHDLGDFKDSDRIALPSVKVSHQAILLQIAAEKFFGPGQQNRLDPLTVSLSHPDAHIALLGNRTGVTGHFGTPPFTDQQLADPRIHKVLSSVDILGGPSTVTSLFTTAKVRDANPLVYRAVFDGVRDAQALIARDHAAAARIYVEEEKPGLSVEAIQALLDKPDSRYSAVPVNIEPFIAFMQRTGLVKHPIGSWRDLYFPELTELPAS